jgi:hypothetical protein
VTQPPTFTRFRRQDTAWSPSSVLISNPLDAVGDDARRLLSPASLGTPSGFGGKATRAPGLRVGGRLGAAQRLPQLEPRTADEVWRLVAGGRTAIATGRSST